MGCDRGGEAMRVLSLWVVLAAGCIPYVDFGPKCLSTGTCPDGGDGGEASVEGGASDVAADVAEVAVGLDAAPEAEAAVMAEAGVDAAEDVAVTADVGADAPRELMCGAGLRACGEACVNTLDDVSNCGACGRACRSDQTCAGGTCECASGRVECGGACRNLQSDAMHCGRCSNACASGVCVAGVCACAAGQTECAGACRTLASDAMHCGRCDNACRSGVCAAGVCAPEQRSCRTAGTPGCGLVEVAGGTFTMGTAFQCNPAAPAERPCGFGSTPVLTDVTVGGFGIDAYEVTVARFNAFWRDRMRDAGASIRATPVAYPGGRVIMWNDAGQEPSAQDGFCNWSASAGARDAHPINCVTWATAMEFCVWDGGRLPTEAEWEFVARGRTIASESLATGREFPWGDMDPPRCIRAHGTGCAGEDGGFTRQVGRYGPSGGVFDLGGNVAEWVADTYATYLDTTCWGRSGLNNPLCQIFVGGARVVPIRGGSWSTSDMRATSRATPQQASTRFSTTGFRCARTRP